MRRDHFNHTASHVNKRLEEGSEKQDLWNLVAGSELLTLEEMYSNAELLMIAGTETTGIRPLLSIILVAILTLLSFSFPANWCNTLSREKSGQDENFN